MGGIKRCSCSRRWKNKKREHKSDNVLDGGRRDVHKRTRRARYESDYEYYQHDFYLRWFGLNNLLFCILNLLKFNSNFELNLRKSIFCKFDYPKLISFLDTALVA